MSSRLSTRAHQGRRRDPLRSGRRAGAGCVFFVFRPQPGRLRNSLLQPLVRLEVQLCEGVCGDRPAVAPAAHGMGQEVEAQRNIVAVAVAAAKVARAQRSDFHPFAGFVRDVVTGNGVWINKSQREPSLRLVRAGPVKPGSGENLCYADCASFLSGASTCTIRMPSEPPATHTRERHPWHLWRDSPRYPGPASNTGLRHRGQSTRSNIMRATPPRDGRA
jgi:hypothetical protein